jgi:hypothetical protein
MIDESVLRKLGLDVPDRSFTERSDFELLAERPRERCCPEAPLPIFRTLSKLVPPVARIICQKEPSGDGTLHRVANVVDIEGIPIRPTMKVSDRANVIRTETGTSGTSAWLRSPPKTMHDSQEQ